MALRDSVGCPPLVIMGLDAKLPKISPFTNYCMVNTLQCSAGKLEYSSPLGVLDFILTKYIILSKLFRGMV